MTHQSPQDPGFEGWRVIDADGNVVSSGGVTLAEADGRIAELLEQAAENEGEQE